MGGSFGKTGSFYLDHQFDDIPLTSRTSSVSTVSGSRDLPPYSKEPPPYDTGPPPPILLETAAEKKARKRSHLVTYATMFIMTVGFSIVLTGVYPYMQSIDESLDKTALGWVVAANPLGQMIASPLLGLLGYKLGSIRLPCIATITCFIVGNAFYSLLNLFDDMGPHSAYYFMIFFRFIVGVSSANVTLCRSYLAQSTTLDERTTGIAIIAASQAMGFVIGPAIQAVLALTIPDDIDTGVDWFQWNKYTAAGWVAALLGFINLTLMLPCIFQEYNIAKSERSLLKAEQAQNNKINLKPNYYVVIGIALASFASVFIFVFFETLLVPFAMDQYAWEDDKAVMIISIATSCSGIITLVMYTCLGPLSKRFQERNLIIFVGFIPLLLGNIFFIPFGNNPIPIANCTSVDHSSTVSPNLDEFTNPFIIPLEHLKFNNEDNVIGNYKTENIYQMYNMKEEDEICGPGCPPSQEWCNDVHQLPEWQLFVGFALIFSTSAVSRAAPLALFTKVLGPNPQQMWIAFLSTLSSLARILGPIIITYLYTSLGTYWLFGLTSTLMAMAVILYICMYKWLVPMKSQQDLEEKHNI